MGRGGLQTPYKVRRRHTYAEIRRRARALAQGLLRAGLEPGDRVATLMSNHHVHLEVYFGVPMSGGVYHTLNMRLAPEDLAYIVHHARDRFLIVDDILLPLLAKFIDLVDFERIFVVSTTGSPIEEGLEDYEPLLQGAREDWLPPPPVDERQAAGMCYTSGTTGHPKGVVYSHRAIVLQSLASGLPDTLGLRQDDIVVPVVPMFHVNAWGLPFTAAMIGASLVFPGPYLDPESLLDLYASEGVTVAAGVPTIWQGILRELGRQPGRWSLTPGLRMIVGGWLIPESMLRAFEEHGIEVVHAGHDQRRRSARAHQTAPARAGRGRSLFLARQERYAPCALRGDSGDDGRAGGAVGWAEDGRAAGARALGGRRLP